MAQEKEATVSIFKYNLELLDILCMSYSILSNSPNSLPDAMLKLKGELIARNEGVAQQYLDITYHYAEDIDLIGSLEVNIH